MKFKVENSVVQKNLEHFKLLLTHILQEIFGEETKKLQEISKKTHEAFINKVTGDIYFLELNKGNSHLDRNWIPVTIHFYLENEKDNRISCKIDHREKIRFIEEKKLNQEALNNLVETIETINIISKLLSHQRDKKKFLKLLSEIQLEFVKTRAEKQDVIHEAWYDMDRFQAEYFLQMKEPGTFFFRKDEFAAILEDCLSLSYDFPIKCITLTALDLENRVCDYTLVYTQAGWQFYNDDPLLQGRIYSSIESLLAEHNTHFKYPLLN